MTDCLGLDDPFRSILRNIFMHYFGLKPLESSKLSFYVQYVDDHFVFIKHSFTAIITLSVMNSINPCIQFLCEIETDICLLFLNVLIRRNNGTQNIAAFKIFVYWDVDNFSFPILLNTEVYYLKAFATDQGYSLKCIDSVFRKLSKPAYLKYVSSKTDFSTPLVHSFVRFGSVSYCDF